MARFQGPQGIDGVAGGRDGRVVGDAADHGSAPDAEVVGEGLGTGGIGVEGDRGATGDAASAASAALPAPRPQKIEPSAKTRAAMAAGGWARAVAGAAGAWDKLGGFPETASAVSGCALKQKPCRRQDLLW